MYWQAAYCAKNFAVALYWQAAYCAKLFAVAEALEEDVNILEETAWT